MQTTCWRSHYCSDAGSEYCPCYLGHIGECLNCAHLAGQGYCDCEWVGVCIYDRYLHTGDQVRFREEKVYAIGERTCLAPGVHVITLKAEADVLEQACDYGSYAFLRNPATPPAFNVPVSLMDCQVESGKVTFAFQVIGPKTRALSEASKTLVVKWPFWNGIVGVQYLRKAAGWNILVVAKGIAQAAAVLIIRKLVARGNRVTYAVGPGTLGCAFTAPIAAQLGARVVELPKEEDHNALRFRLLVESCRYHLVVSLGPEVQHLAIAGLCRQLRERPRLAFSNNAVLCCGEGICGACATPVNGTVVKRCKASFDPYCVMGVHELPKLRRRKLSE